MKKIVFLFALTVLSISAYPQTSLSGNKTKVKSSTGRVQLKTIEPTEPETAPPPPPPPVNKQESTAPNTPAPVYALTSVRVRVRTGNDNKEFPSKVYARLMAKSTPANWRNYNQWNLTNEMRINSETEFGLNLEGPAVSLETFQVSGLKFSLTYEPNFFADAWKIENITLVLEFKDQFGNLHPTLGYKTIIFSNAYGFLNNEYRYIDCYTDGSFAPMTSVIHKL